MKKETPGTDLQYGIRKAVNSDVKETQKLINHFAQEGLMLPRSQGELYDNLRDFHVCHVEKKIVGVCALHVVWENFAEIKSLAVASEYQGQGIGSFLIEASMQEAASLGIGRVFTLTYRPEFFEKFGFRLVDKDILPQKVWGECIKCVKFPDCNEVAMVYEVSLLERNHPQ